MNLADLITQAATQSHRPAKHRYDTSPLNAIKARAAATIKADKLRHDTYRAVMHGKGPMWVIEIATLLGKPHQTCNRSLKNLIADGYVRRLKGAVRLDTRKVARYKWVGA